MRMDDQNCELVGSEVNESLKELNIATVNNKKGAFKKYVRSKFPVFDPLPILFVPLRFTCTPPQPMFVLVSYKG